MPRVSSRLVATRPEKEAAIRPLSCTYSSLGARARFADARVHCAFSYGFGAAIMTMVGALWLDGCSAVSDVSPGDLRETRRMLRCSSRVS